MSSDDSETDFADLESDEARLANEETPRPYQTEVEQIVNARLTAIQEESAARRRRREYLKFGILAAILLGAVIVIALAQPLIFEAIVPAVMGGDGNTAVLDDSQPADGPVSDPDAPSTPDTSDANTQNLPIISVPGSDDTGTGGAGEEEATAVPAQIYVVQLGDTLNSIARQFNTTVEAIIAANNIQDPDALLVGATLTIPQPVQ